MGERKESNLLTVLTGIRMSIDSILENSGSDLTIRELNCLNNSAGKIIEIEQTLLKKSTRVFDELGAVTTVESLIEAGISFSLDFFKSGDIGITTSKENWDVMEKVVATSRRSCKSVALPF